MAHICKCVAAAKISKVEQELPILICRRDGNEDEPTCFCFSMAKKELAMSCGSSVERTNVLE